MTKTRLGSAYEGEAAAAEEEEEEEEEADSEVEDEEEEDEEEEGPFAGLEKETVGILADKVGGESGGH